MKKKIENLFEAFKLTLVCLVLLLAASFKAMALNQPVVYSFIGTNSVPALSTNVVPGGGAVFTNLNGTAVQTNLDIGFQSQFTVYAAAQPLATGAGTQVGNLTFNGLQSPDQQTWVPAPAFVVPVSGTNGPSTLVSNITTTYFRFYTVTNISWTGTNSYFTNYNGTIQVTNGGYAFKIFWKGP